MIGDHSRRQHKKLSTLCSVAFFVFFHVKKWADDRIAGPCTSSLLSYRLDPNILTLFVKAMIFFDLNSLKLSYLKYIYDVISLHVVNLFLLFFFMDYGIFLDMIYVQPFMIFLFNFIDFLFSTCLWKEIKRNLTTMHRWCVILMYSYVEIIKALYFFIRKKWKDAFVTRGITGIIFGVSLRKIYWLQLSWKCLIYLLVRESKVFQNKCLILLFLHNWALKDFQ